MKVLLLAFCFFYFINSALNAQITVSHSTETKLIKTYKAPLNKKEENSLKKISSLKRTVKVIKYKKEAPLKKKKKTSKRKSKAINDDDIPF